MYFEFGSSDTNFCESLLLPTEHSLKRSLQATFTSAIRRTHLENKIDQIDGCCRSLYKCDAHKRIALNQMNTAFSTYQHCDCIHFFQICLDKFNTSLANEVALLHSINTTKCYTNDHPIIECIKFQSHPEWKTKFLRFVDQTERKRLLNRCSKYELDKTKPQQLQLRDVPFSYYGMSVNDTRNISQDAFFPYQS